MSAFVNNGLASWRRSHASLLAGAMGDSLGADIEFLSLAQIRLRFPEGLTALPPHEGIAGAVTDDTQMTLFTAEGLIRAVVRGTLRGICHPPSVVHHALLRWYRTQGGRPAMDTDDVGLVRDKRLHAVRAPGNTCLHALREAHAFGQPARNTSKGCGTIMRVAPVALIARPDTVFRLAMETAALTHGHPTGQIAAAAWALLLSNVMAGAALEAAAEEIAQRCLVLDGGKETAAAIHAALNAPRDGRPETVESLGGGWVAEEALSIALYCSLAAADLKSGLRMAVMHGGDSDSTGAIAGNMLGLLFSDQVFQHPWSRQVECADLIADLARDLHDAQTGGEAWAESAFERYPGS
jgi:ADP-ribosyl-[dinitrogen reductase] hydrolase